MAIDLCITQSSSEKFLLVADGNLQRKITTDQRTKNKRPWYAEH